MIKAILVSIVAAQSSIPEIAAFPDSVAIDF
jgi:hypothetical protein